MYKFVNAIFWDDDDDDDDDYDVVITLRWLLCGHHYDVVTNLRWGGIPVKNRNALFHPNGDTAWCWWLS